MKSTTVLVLGGYGSYGRIVSTELAKHQAIDLIVAGRNVEKGNAFAQRINATFRPCDLTDVSSLQSALHNIDIVINAAGPFQEVDYTIPQQCIKAQCHYIDFGDGRAYVENFVQLDELAKQYGVFACTGASTSPAITGAMVSHLQNGVSDIMSINAALAPGNKNQAGHSTVKSILDYVGKPIQVWLNGQWTTAYGWSLGRFTTFPHPVGKRRVQLCNVPDLALFPDAFKAKEVLFYAGLELTPFNYALALLGRIKRQFPSVDLTKLTTPLIQGSNLFKSFGSYSGSVAVWVKDSDGEERSLALVALKDGPCVPAAPAILLTYKLAQEKILSNGAFACINLFTFKELSNYLSQFGILSITGQNGLWDS